MIIGGTHWVLAMGIAVSIHLAGLFWLSLPEPATKERAAEPAGESLVVALGRDAQRAAESVSALQPEQAAAIADTTAPEPVVPEAVTEAPAETVEPATAATDTAASVDAVAPEVETVDAVEAVSTPPADAVETAAPAPETVAAIDQSPAELSPEPETVVAASPVESGAEPQLETPAEAPATVPTTQAASVETVQTRDTPGAVPPDAPTGAPEVAEARSARSPTDSPPTRFADETIVPEASGGAVDIEEVPAAQPGPGSAAGTEAVQVTGVEAAPDTGDSVGEVTEITAGTATGSVAEVETVTAARQPDPSVVPADEPAVTEAPEPEVIDLEALQENSGGAGVVARYAGVLKGRLQQSMHYPRAARLAGHEGEVVVRFVIDRQGNVQSIEVESRSGYPLLDREAGEMIERADPLPAMPEEMPGERLEIRVPVSFSVRDETMTKEIPPIYLE